MRRYPWRYPLKHFLKHNTYTVRSLKTVMRILRPVMHISASKQEAVMHIWRENRSSRHKKVHHSFSKLHHRSENPPCSQCLFLLPWQTDRQEIKPMPTQTPVRAPQCLPCQGGNAKAIHPPMPMCQRYACLQSAWVLEVFLTEALPLPRQDHLLYCVLPP